MAGGPPYACSIDVTVGLVDYPGVATVTINYGVIVTMCQVTAFTVTGTPADQIYNIDWDPQLDTALPTYAQTPACNHAMTDTAYHDATEMPVNGHSVNTGSSQLELSSTDRVNDPGVYTVMIKMSLVDPAGCDVSLSPCEDTS